MESLYLLVPISVLIVFVAIWIFLAMSDSGQFDDMLGPALTIIQDDDRATFPGTGETGHPRHLAHENAKATQPTAGPYAIAENDQDT